ncbi:hypothetical protein ACWNYI_00315 [Candidatus Vidania fulgoroideorum]
MLKIKLKKTKNRFVYNICILDAKKKNSRNMKKIGYINRYKKIININRILFENYNKEKLPLSKGFKKITCLLNNNNDYKILFQN